MPTLRNKTEHKNLILHLKKLEKEETEPKTSIRKEISKIREDISKRPENQ